jgi:predicted Zn-dependent protease
MNAVEELFAAGIQRYEAGEAPATLIPIFKEIVDQQPKNGTAMTCLAWLYLLNEEAPKALKFAKQAVKLAPADAQAYVNQALAILDAKASGVREPIERAKQIMQVDASQAEEVQRNCTDGLTRKPDWKALQKVQKWLFEE